MTLVDLSPPLRPAMPTWPGGRGFSIEKVSDISSGDEATVSTITMDLHSGVHIDAPAHFVLGGESVEEVDLETCIGPAFVADLSGLVRIDAEALDGAVPIGVERLLMRTDNGSLWEESKFSPDFVALTVDGAQWLAESGVRLVGNDYLSIQLFGGDPRTHTVLMEAGIVIVEGLDLRQAPLGSHELFLLPLNIQDAEAAPARALLRVSKESDG